jgi:Tfp pilus assembly protein PilN
MRARLNLATSPLESNRRFSLVATIVGLIAVIALAGLSWHVVIAYRGDTEARAREAALEKDIAALQQQRMGLAAYFNEPATVQRRERAAYLNGLIHQRAFPWIKIFMDLERTLPEGVRVVSVEPRMEGDNVQLKFVVGAITDEGKLNFLKKLESSPEFSHIQLIQENRPAQNQNQSDHILMELQAQYSDI